MRSMWNLLKLVEAHKPPGIVAGFIPSTVNGDLHLKAS
jgi:hypothetical protein